VAPHARGKLRDERVEKIKTALKTRIIPVALI
jgi:hypothetical protein